ncbi:MAG TPA: biosynthetic peptidoglycan transglycosylase, partial [Kofleriaceae bacterium]|nr:biosynthetic peptidoglycan transglycosylase [Kofleriaceae bacterium]
MRARIALFARRAWAVLRSPRLRWPRRIFGALLALLVLASVSWWIAVRAADFPLHLLDRSAATSLVVASDNGLLLRQEATSAGLRERWISLDQISPHLVHATLASEDHEFHDHAGVDWTAMLRSAWLNVRSGGAEFGGSTITMQLVRLTAGTPRTLPGKLRQMVLAARLERALGKREILEHYLNRVYYGNSAWGAEQAARVYFDKPAGKL